MVKNVLKKAWKTYILFLSIEMFIHFHTFSMLWGEIFISADGAGGGMAGLLFLVGFGVCDMITNEKKGRLSMKIAK